MDYIAAINKEQMKAEIPTINVGDNVRVHNRIKEGNRERRRSHRDLYRPPRILRRRSRKDLPGAFSQRCRRRYHEVGRRQTRKALLSARQSRQSFQGQGEDLTFKSGKKKNGCKASVFETVLYSLFLSSVYCSDVSSSSSSGRGSTVTISFVTRRPSSISATSTCRRSKSKVSPICGSASRF